MNILKRSVGYCFLKLTGWSFEKDYQWQDKQVVVGFPHTSNMDGVRTLLMFPLLGIEGHFLIKQELFRWPFSWLLKYMGGVPVARGKKSNTVEQIAGEFAKHQKFTLVLAPEGTRSKMDTNVPVIKTGFWQIARQARVPIVLMMSDGKNKRGRFLDTITPGDNLSEDLITIRDIYQREGVTIRLPDSGIKEY